MNLLDGLTTVWFPFLLDTAVKTAIVLGIVELALCCWRRQSASTRHALRFAAITVTLLLPLAMSWMPAAPRPAWTLSSQRTSGNELSLALELAPTHLSNSKQPSSSVEDSTLTASQPQFPIHVPLFWERFVAGSWFVGTAFFTVPLLLGLLQRRRLMRESRAVNAQSWGRLCDQTRERIGVRPCVTLRIVDKQVVPMTWGLFRPVILLPARAEEWSEDRRRIVLLHELAHVKRRDDFTQMIAQFACALHWFNPLVWRTVRALRLDREQACDDLVLENGWKASAYAEHLVSIAGSLKSMPACIGIAVVRQSQLERRVRALVDDTRVRRAPSIAARLAIACALALLIGCVAAQKSSGPAPSNLQRIHEKQLAQLRQFAAQKEEQAEILTAKSHEEIIPEFRVFFAAAKKGDWQTVTNMYDDFHHRHPQYNNSKGDLPHTAYWSTVLEVALAYIDVTWGEPDHVQLAVDGFMKAVRPGAIYFGGTDPGRGLPTTFSRDHAKADPFFTITQNALADGSYLEYVRATYGDRIYIPTQEDSGTAFGNYIQDATARLKENKLKPGENVRVVEGKVEVSGQVAVMDINARLAKIIFDKNPDREFYIEESFPLEWMYPHLTPAGQVMKINRAPLDTISDETIERDADFWNERIQRFLHDRLSQAAPVQNFVDQLQTVYVKKTSKADARFLQNDWAQRAFSKWRSAMAGVYAWRCAAAKSPGERERMGRAAEFAFRQSMAICPKSLEAILRYVNFLVGQNRTDDAKLIVSVALKVDPENKALQDVRNSLAQKP